MKNSEKYKTVEERTDAFLAFCDGHEECGCCPAFGKGHAQVCAFRWLELDAKESEAAK